MAVTLDRIVPFGRSLAEYRLMFALTAADLQRQILSIADGPASFNAEATPLGANIQSIDPIYQFGGPEIRQRFGAVVDDIIAQIGATPDAWSWEVHDSPAALRASREQTLELFLADYDRGRQEGRYHYGALPHLDCTNGQFDLVLCSHFLLLYSAHLDYAFHRQALQELLRVGREVRIFPLLTLACQRSPYLDKLMTEFAQQGYRPTIKPVEYELQKGGNEMLVVRL
ncbi:MAG: class I SAM-dependent methyltransferase [Cyanobacteria bacterium J06641_5]